jgi:hypothetical protein
MERQCFGLQKAAMELSQCYRMVAIPSNIIMQSWDFAFPSIFCNRNVYYELKKLHAPIFFAPDRNTWKTFFGKFIKATFALYDVIKFHITIQALSENVLAQKKLLLKRNTWQDSEAE